MDHIIITQHGEKRARKRLGIPKKAVERKALLALEKGISFQKAKGRLKKYIHKEYKTYGVSNNIRVYGDYVFVFRDNILITLFPLPSFLKKKQKMY